MGFFVCLYKLTFLYLGCIIYGMKKIILSLFISALPVVANAYIDKTNAVIRILNKDAGKVSVHKVVLNQDFKFEKLKIVVRSCKQSDPFEAENFWAFVEIDDVDPGRVFSNWMNRNEPGENPLQHADYDVWLVKCE